MASTLARFGIREIDARTLLAPIVKHYRQTTYGDQYTIEFVQQPNAWELYCTEHPDNPYSERVQDCHLYSSGQICVRTGHEPRTLDRAKAIAAAFIDGYSHYVRTGKFPTKARAYNV